MEILILQKKKKKKNGAIRKNSRKNFKPANILTAVNDWHIEKVLYKILKTNNT